MLMLKIQLWEKFKLTHFYNTWDSFNKQSVRATEENKGILNILKHKNCKKQQHGQRHLSSACSHRKKKKKSSVFVFDTKTFLVWIAAYLRVAEQQLNFLNVSSQKIDFCFICL